MLQRCLSQKSVLTVLVVLALNVAPQARAEEPLVHAQYALYELREAKEDIRDLKDFPADRKKKLLGAVEDTLATLKTAIEDAGSKAKYVKPDPRPTYENWKHLRHSIKMLKQAKDQIKKEKGFKTEDARTKGIQQINLCIDLLEKALEHVK